MKDKEKIVTAKNKKHRRHPILFCSLLSVGAALTIAVNLVLFFPLSHVLDAFFVSAGGNTALRESAQKNAIQTAENIEGEGAVLLRNENEALPLSLSTDSKINVLGYRSSDFIYSGSGSGSVSTASGVTLIDALKTEGFVPNPSLISLYGDSTGTSSGGVGNVDFSIDELPLSKYTGDCSMDNLKAYSNTAIVVLGRNGGEGSDLPMTGYGTSKTNSYLHLSSEEEDLIQTASTTFDKVIVLLDSANPMELGFLSDDNIDACLWVGEPGAYGCTAIAKILDGTINPSGRTVDTYVYDALSAPAVTNFGDFSYSNFSSGHYVDYAEGIYVGYRWYETAYTSGYYSEAKYRSTVQYPFGYGLSYSTFTQTLSGGTTDGSELDPTGEVTLKATVKNTGSASGKDVVEAYYSAPYVEGGVEKSAINLAGFAKTDELKPNESQSDIEITIPVEDIASYDTTANNGAGAYILDAGTYVFSLRNNAHDEIGSISCTLPEKYVYSGDNKRSTDKVAATNLFSDASGDVTYLSRENGFSNYSQAIATSSKEASASIITALTTGYKDYDDDYTGTKPTLAADNGIKLADMRGLSYDDSKWNSLLDELHIGELKDLIGYGGYQTVALDSIDKVATLDSDGPCGISYYMSSSTIDCVAYPCEDVLGATWNQTLANDYGESVGQEGNAWGVTGWYAPACNIHRTAFCGRDYEYFSEDPFLSGAMDSSVVKGARSKGLITYTKHFAVNEQEKNRDQLLCVWSNEQALREIYLRPFEMAVKDGDTNGIMTSYSLIGDRWCGASKALLTDALRDEWGFVGTVITDYNGYDYMDPDAAIWAGNDLMLSTLGKRPSESTAGGIYAMRQCAHNILYTVVNSSAYDTSISSSSTSSLSWKQIAYIIDGVLGAGFVVGYVFVGLDFAKWYREKKQKKDELQK